MMDSGNPGSAGMLWLLFAFGTVCCWGLYGIFLHAGQLGMADPQNGRYKAFLFVGLAYLVTAVLGSLVILWLNGADWVFPSKGVWLSLVAGIVGAVGAFFVLLAFGAKGTPTVVMSIIFAGAPIVNAVTAILMHPPRGGLGSFRWQFLLGILLAALGGCLVSLYKPGPPAANHPPAAREEALKAEVP